MKKYIIISIALILSVSTYLQARDLSPNFTIRYEDFINNTTPSAAIGLKLDIDGDRYTGFQVNSDGTDSRLLMGWKWGVIGIGAIDVSEDSDGTDILPHYTFGVGYEIIDGLTTNFEYCMTPDATGDQLGFNANSEERLRLSLSVSF
tara:strand:+ start:254 stop:694 length:441 start_codon:yes stop_codon:yes gene_type:complete